MRILIKEVVQEVQPRKFAVGHGEKFEKLLQKCNEITKIRFGLNMLAHNVHRFMVTAKNSSTKGLAYKKLFQVSSFLIFFLSRYQWLCPSSYS